LPTTRSWHERFTETTLATPQAVSSGQIIAVTVSFSFE
jgi:hypothetical protein